MFVPINFKPPVQYECENFVLHKLSAYHVYLDYIAVMSNIDLIHKTRGGNWPTPQLTFEDNLIDLAWHQREFECGHSYAYTVLDKSAKKCLGCLYFYPPDFRKPSPDGSDVDVSFWVIKEAFEAGLYKELQNVVQKWLESSWPWKMPFWSNEVLS